MTEQELRDYFAAKAMQAILTNNKIEDCDDHVVARVAYQMANFMLEAREDNMRRRSQVVD